MTKKHPQRGSVEKAMGHMKMSDVCVKIHSAEQMRIGSVESRAVRPRTTRVSPNLEARLLSEARSQIYHDEDMIKGS